MLSNNDRLETMHSVTDSNPLHETDSVILNTQVYEESLSNLKSSNDRLWRMRWFVLIIVAIGFLCSLVASVVLIILAKTLLTLIVPPSIILIMRPIVHWLFPPEQRNKTLLGNSGILTTLQGVVGAYVGAKEVAKKLVKEMNDRNPPEREE